MSKIKEKTRGFIREMLAAQFDNVISSELSIRPLRIFRVNF
jgi:hypothetical protein